LKRLKSEIIFLHNIRELSHFPEAFLVFHHFAKMILYFLFSKGQLSGIFVLELMLNGLFITLWLDFSSQRKASLRFLQEAFKNE